LLLLTVGVGVVPGAVIIVGLPTWNAIEGVFDGAELQRIKWGDIPTPKGWTMAAAGVAQETHLSDHPIGWRRYLYSTNHKDIGPMYLDFALMAGIIGGALSIGMRMELQQVGFLNSGSPGAFGHFVDGFR
jgi:hypothetical protein